NGLMQLFQVSEGLQDDEIHAFFVQGCNLLVKGRPGFLERDLAQGLDADSQRSDGAGDQGVETLGSLPCQASTQAIDIGQLVHTSMLGQAKRIGAKGVCFNDVGSGLEVFLVDPADQVGLRQVELVVAAVDEDTLGIQQRAHGAVA